MATSTITRPATKGAKTDTTQRVKATLLTRLQGVQAEPADAAQAAQLAHPYAVQYARWLLGEVKNQPHATKYGITKKQGAKIRDIVRSVTPDNRATAKPKRKRRVKTTLIAGGGAVVREVPPKAVLFTSSDHDMLRAGIAAVVAERKASYEEAKALAAKLGA